MLFMGFGLLMIASDCEDPYGPPDPSPQLWPQWSSDGTRIVFGGPRIYVVESDGSRLQWVDGPENYSDGIYSPSISPDGSRMAFVTYRYKTDGLHNWEIGTSALDGSDERRLTKNEALDVNPVWSPDGTLIAFLSTRDSGYVGKFNLYVMQADGSDVRSVVPSVQSSSSPGLWSPDGSRLAFRGEGPIWGEGPIYVVSSNGLDLRKLGSAMGQPAWSPDGQHLGYARVDPDGEDNLFTLVIVSVDGSEKREIFSAPFSDSVRANWYSYVSDITWSRDGSEIRFVATQFVPVPTRGDSFREVTGVHAIKTDGSGLRMMAELEPPGLTAWSPDGSSIAVSMDYVRFKPFVVDSNSVLLYTVDSNGSDMRVLLRGVPLRERED